jgi:hypothetical protein
MSEKNNNELWLAKSQDPIDLSKIPAAYYQDLWNRIIRGSSPGTLFRWGAGIFATLIFLSGGFVGISRGIANFSYKTEQVGEKPKGVPTSAIHPPDSIQPTLPDPEKLLLSEENSKLKIEIADLQARLNKKPEWITCQRYISDITERQKYKYAIDQKIQMLLNPPLTQEQIAQGFSYSSNYLEAYAKQAEEYRKIALDVQQEIAAIMVAQKECQ